MPSFIDSIAGIKPREKSGAKTAGRFDFQLNASFLKVLEWHKDGRDYVALFDYIDDLVLIASPNEDSKAFLYQIKSRQSGHWKISDIVRLEKGQPPRSIVGKMFSGVVVLDGKVEKIAFLTNADFKLKKNDGTTTSADDFDIRAEALATSEITKIGKAVDADFSPPQRHDYLHRLAFERTSLGVNDQRALVLGKLAEFFEEQFNAKAVPTTAVYETLLRLFREKASCTRAHTSPEGLIESKGVARADVKALLEKAASTDTVLKLWGVVDVELNAGGFSSREKIELKNYGMKYSLALAGGDPIARRLHTDAKIAIIRQKGAVSAIGSVLGLAHLLVEHVTPIAPYEGRGLKAAMIVEAIEEMNGS